MSGISSISDPILKFTLGDDVVAEPLTWAGFDLRKPSLDWIPKDDDFSTRLWALGFDLFVSAMLCDLLNVTCRPFIPPYPLLTSSVREPLWDVRCPSVVTAWWSPDPADCGMETETADRTSSLWSILLIAPSNSEETLPILQSMPTGYTPVSLDHKDISSLMFACPKSLTFSVKPETMLCKSSELAIKGTTLFNITGFAGLLTGIWSLESKKDFPSPTFASSSFMFVSSLSMRRNSLTCSASEKAPKSWGKTTADFFAPLSSSFPWLAFSSHVSTSWTLFFRFRYRLKW